MHSYTQRQQDLNAQVINSRIPESPEEREPCPRCEGEGEYPASWGIVKLDLESIMALMTPSKERFCAMYKIYRQWRDRGTVNCWRCGG